MPSRWTEPRFTMGSLELPSLRDKLSEKRKPDLQGPQKEIAESEYMKTINVRVMLQL